MPFFALYVTSLALRPLPLLPLPVLVDVVAVRSGSAASARGFAPLLPLGADEALDDERRLCFGWNAGEALVARQAVAVRAVDVVCGVMLLLLARATRPSCDENMACSVLGIRVWSGLVLR